MPKDRRSEIYTAFYKIGLPAGYSVILNNPYNWEFTIVDTFTD